MVRAFVSSERVQAARACTWLFAAAAIASCLYVIVTGTYNGDFFGVEATIGIVALTAILLGSLAPYVLAWALYRFFTKRRRTRVIAVPPRALTVVFFVFLLWFIALALKYEVGVLGKQIYDAPSHLKPLIQISNRVNPFYLGVLFILVHKGARWILWVGILLLITLGLLRASLGVFLYVGVALFVRNFAYIRNRLMRRKAVIIVGLLLFPIFVSQMYSLRASLRGEASEVLSMSPTEIVAARLVGRLSSFSNSALVVQETERFRSEVQALDPIYFVRQAFGGVFGVAFIPEVTPERLLIGIYGGDYFDVSFMVGVPGNLYLASLISPFILVLNGLLLVAMCVMVFVVARLLGFREANEFALLLLLYPLTSGVGNEFSSLIIALLSFCAIFLFLRLILLAGPRGTRVCGVYVQGERVRAGREATVRVSS